MAKRPSSSTPPRKDTFLGGGMQFNKVGTSIPGSSPPPPNDERPQIIVPAHARTQALRTTVIVVVLFILVALLFIFGSDTLSGVEHTGGRGGVSGQLHPDAPPRNF